MRSFRVARRYAAALMLAAEETKTLDEVSADVDQIRRLVNGSRDLRLLLASPVITPAKKTGVLKELLRNTVRRETLTFVLLLVQKGREELLADIMEQYMHLWDEKRGVIDVEVTSAVPLEKPHEKALTEQIERSTKKKVRMHLGIDASLKGGLVVRIGDHVLDGSVTNQLKLLRDRFAAGASLS